MVSNNKCILAYGFSKEELISLENTNEKIIKVLPEMSELTIRDILKGINVKTPSHEHINEKFILLNNFSNNELQSKIKNIRKNVNGGMMAIVTETSIDWKFSYLAKHLIEERDLYLNQQKGR